MKYEYVYITVSDDGNEAADKLLGFLREGFSIMSATSGYYHAHYVLCRLIP